MRTQTEFKELLAVYENELVENPGSAELAALVTRIRAQIIEGVPSDPEPSDPEPSQPED